MGYAEDSLFYLLPEEALFLVDEVSQSFGNSINTSLVTLVHQIHMYTRREFRCFKGFIYAMSIAVRTIRVV